MQGIFALLIFGWLIGSWITHLMICFSDAAWGFLVAGVLFFPIAVAHGTGAWFGAW